MLPVSRVDFDETKVQAGTKAFKIDFENKKIGELIDGKDALIQAVQLALMTKRYEYPIFSHSYGTDYKNAFQEGYIKAIGTIKNAVYESLMCDDRIENVYDFQFEKIHRGIKLRFVVSTIYGDIIEETEVEGL